MENEFPGIRAVTAGSMVKTVLLVASSSFKQARNGPFWQLELKDATGSLEARVWSPLSQNFTEIPTGSLAEVEGRAEQYRDQIQLNLSSFRLLSGEEAEKQDLSRFMPSSRIPAADMLAELEDLCHNILIYKPWRKFALGILRDDWVRPRLLRAPAARSVHHAWVGGLLEHTLGVCRLCLKFAELYPGLDEQTLFAAALFHDIGKLREFSVGLNPDYTDEGRLLGHISLGIEMLTPRLSKSGLDPAIQMHFRHMILSHHGQLEYGSPCLPQTPEAFALHYADDIDAKLTQCFSLLPEETPTGSWSPFQRTLERSLFLPPKTPEPKDADSGGAKRPHAKSGAENLPELQQCSLL